MFDDQPITVDLYEEDPAGSVTEQDDGSLLVDFDGDETGGQSEATEQIEFYGNLVPAINRNELAVAATDIIEWVKVDERARAPWLRRFEAGIKASGLLQEREISEADDIIDAAMAITHPLIIEACVQFQSRAIQEMFPPAGPVKGTVNGHATEALRDQADRVADYLNYQITKEDKTYFWDVDQMLFMLPLTGSAFKKSYYDPEWRTVRSVLCKATDILLPYTVTNLYDATRITHRIPMPHNRLLRLQASGYYSDVTVPTPSDASGDWSSLGSVIDRADDKEYSIAEGDAEHRLLECHCMYQFESLGDEFAVPYIITVDQETEQVLGVRRNWREDDDLQRPMLRFTQYKYLPGLGAYGFGLFHAIGGLGEAATGIVRMLLISAAYNALPGGFKSRDAKMAGSVKLKPGEFQDVDMTYEELQKAFWTPQFRDPGNAFPTLLQAIVEAGQRFSSTTEAMVGDASNNGPVGTTLALIEQGSKIYSAIHKRLHRSAGEEFEIRFELNAQHLPDQYPYAVNGKSRMVMRADFSDAVSVTPVSDPNIFSSAQRIAMAQGQLELANSAPGMYDLYEAHRRMLEAMRTPDIDDLLPDPNTIPHADPVSEGSYLLVGKPIRAHEDEAHDAHLAVHASQLQQFQAMPPEISGNAINALLAHMAEHAAIQYRIQMAMQMGIDLPALDLASKQREEQPVEIGNAIAMRAGMLIEMQAQAMAQQQAMAEQDAMAAQAQGEADTQSQKLAMDREAQQQKFQLEQEHQTAALQAELIRDQVRQAAEFLAEKGAPDVPPQALYEVSQRLGKSFDEALAVIRKAQAQQQGSSQFEQTAGALQ